jgi:hypothetical protein
MSTKEITLDLDLPEFYKVLTFVSESLTGEFGVQELERRVQSLAKTAPFLVKLLAAAGEAIDRLESIQGLPRTDDPEVTKLFLQHNETFCCLQGSLAMLIAVSEILQKRETGSKPLTRKRKKS